MREAFGGKYPEDSDIWFLSDLLLRLVENSDTYAGELIRNKRDETSEGGAKRIEIHNSICALQILPEIVKEENTETTERLELIFKRFGVKELTGEIGNIESKELEEGRRLLRMYSGAAWECLGVLAEDR